MSDFVSELRRELVAAAEREQARSLPRAPLVRPRMLLLAGAAAAAAAVVLVLALGGLRTEPAHNQRVPAARPTPEGRELFGGSLEEGVRYRTRAFIPAISFVTNVPDWAVYDGTKADILGLDLRKQVGELEQEGPPIGALVFLRMPVVFDPAVKDFEKSRVAAPADLHAWLRAHPDLRVGPERQTTLAGVPGVGFDAVVRFDEPVYENPQCRQRTLKPCTFIAPNLAFFDGERLHVTILRTEPDPLIVLTISESDSGLRKVDETAKPLLDTLRIGVG